MSILVDNDSGGILVKKIVVYLMVALLFTCHAVADEATIDFSQMTNEEINNIIQSAQDELNRRATSKEIQNSSNNSENDSSENTLYIQDARLLVQSNDYKALYPDMLQAILVNNTEYDIKNAVIAFMAWDANNLPVLIKGQFDFNKATYIRQGNYNGINMVPGSTFGEKTGMKLDESITGIVTVKAIVVSYETFDGNTWTNPDYEAFVEQYAGKKLE